MDLVLLQGTAPTPITGYLICYIPLAVVVLGLITWFVITDRHASRPYLRYNPFVAAGATEEELAAREPAVGETPAGPLGAPAGMTGVSSGEHGAGVVVPKEAVPAPTVPERTPPLEGESGPVTPGDHGRVTGVNLPDVDQSADAPSAPPTDVAPPAAKEIEGATLAGSLAGVPAADPDVAHGVAITFVEFDPAGSDLAGEYVRIQNNSSDSVTLTDWRLRDAGNKHVFSFPEFTLAPGAEVQLWTGSGADDAANLYWKQRGAVWNNTGDTAILEDASGREVSQYTYEGNK